jgi:Fur family transcriptional regulator, ferric uptake regulator
MAETSQAWSEHALERLSDAGFRRGGARQVVIELLDEQPCALSALDIEDELRARQGRRVGRASIYRVLDELVTLDLLSRVEVGDGVARYEPQRPHHDEHHHHLVCDGCGRLEPFKDDAIEKAIRGLAARVAFDVSDHDVTLHGCCESCRAASPNV